MPACLPPARCYSQSKAMRKFPCLPASRPVNSLPGPVRFGFAAVLAFLAAIGLGCHYRSGTSLLGKTLSSVPVSGTYVCRSMGSHACDQRTEINLTAQGVWSSTGSYSGSYSVNGDQVTFNGFGGPAGWGAARFAHPPAGDTLTFGNVVFQQPAPIPASLPGIYKCQGCFGTIVLQADGTWKYPDGSDGGSYYILDGQLQFSGLTSGPAAWGPARLTAGSFSFGSTGHPLRFAKQ